MLYLLNQRHCLLLVIEHIVFLITPIFLEFSCCNANSKRLLETTKPSSNIYLSTYEYINKHVNKNAFLEYILSFTYTHTHTHNFIVSYIHSFEEIQKANIPNEM